MNCLSPGMSRGPCSVFTHFHERHGEFSNLLVNNIPEQIMHQVPEMKKENTDL